MAPQFAALAAVSLLAAGCAGPPDRFPSRPDRNRDGLPIGIDWNQVPNGLTIPATSFGVDLVQDGNNARLSARMTCPG